jgi:hypothetical protein
MDFLECIKLYAKKPGNASVNSAAKKPEVVDWSERLQGTRRLLIDQLSRLKIEEMCLRNLALNSDTSKRSRSLAIPDTDGHTSNDGSNEHQPKRFCGLPTNEFDLETINQTELDLDCD